jgi:hypothetical protein
VESNSDCYYKNFTVDSGTNRYRIIVAGKAVEIELLSASNIFSPSCFTTLFQIILSTALLCRR